MNGLDEASLPAPLNMGRLKAMSRRQWWVVVLVCVASVAGAAGYAQDHPESSAASVTVPTGIPNASSGQGAAASGTASFPDPTVDATGRQVVQAAAHGAGLGTGSVKLTATTGTSAGQVVLTATEPQRLQAERAAEAAAAEFKTVWTRHLSQVNASTAPQLASVRHQLASLEARAGAAVRKTHTGASAQPTSPLAVEIQVVSAQYATLYAQEVQYQLAVTAVKSSPVTVPTVAAVGTSKAKLVLIALGVGLLIGCAIALLRDTARDRMTGPDELAELEDLPLLAELPRSRLGRRPSFPRAFEGRLGEAARELRAAIAFAPHRRPLKTVLVTSAGSAEGKSVTAASLAVAWSLAGARTVLVSSDLRHPSTERLLGLDPSAPGLAQLLRPVGANGTGAPPRTAPPVGDVLQRTAVSGLFVLPSGGPSASPAELLGSDAMTDVVEQLSTLFDIVVFDSPPLLAVADALVLQRHATGVVLVLASGLSRKGDVRRALQVLDRSQANLRGYVLNLSGRSGLRSYRYGKNAVPTVAPAGNGARPAGLPRH